MRVLVLKVPINYFNKTAFIFYRAFCERFWCKLWFFFLKSFQDRRQECKLSNEAPPPTRRPRPHLSWWKYTLRNKGAVHILLIRQSPLLLEIFPERTADMAGPAHVPKYAALWPRSQNKCFCFQSFSGTCEEPVKCTMWPCIIFTTSAQKEKNIWMSEIIKILGKQVRGCDGTVLVPKKTLLGANGSE